MYWDDRFGTETVSPEVLARMKQLMVDNQSAASHSFLLDDDSSIPFSLDDIQNLMEDRVRHPEDLSHINMKPVYAQSAMALPGQPICVPACWPIWYRVPSGANYVDHAEPICCVGC